MQVRIPELLESSHHFVFRERIGLGGLLTKEMRPGTIMYEFPLFSELLCMFTIHEFTERPREKGLLSNTVAVETGGESFFIFSWHGLQHMMKQALSPRWTKVFELFNQQEIRHLGVKATALRSLTALVEIPLHYVGDSSPKNLIFSAPQWTTNRYDYQDALLWADILYSKELSVVNQGSSCKGTFSHGQFILFMTLSH